MQNNVPTDKKRRLPPLPAVLNRLKDAPIEKVQELVRSSDILGYTYKQQSQIHAAVAQRLKLEAEGQEPQSFNCHDCHKVFDDMPRLKRHLLTHGPRNYRCHFPGCTWSFTFAKDLERHNKKHGMGIQVFKCGFEGCGRLMNRRDNARYHIRTIHGLGYGEANALVQVLPIDINTPDQQSDAAENDQSPKHSEDQEVTSDSQPEAPAKLQQQTSVQKANEEDLEEEQKLRDMIATYTTLGETEDPINDKPGTGNFPVRKTTPGPSIHTKLGAQRSQTKKLKDRVKQVWYTTTRPKPPMFSKKDGPRQQRGGAIASSESLVRVASTRTQASASKLAVPAPERKALFEELLSVGGRQSTDVIATDATDVPRPLKFPEPPTRTAPPPPVQAQAPVPVKRPPIPTVNLIRPQSDNSGEEGIESSIPRVRHRVARTQLELLSRPPSRETSTEKPERQENPDTLPVPKRLVIDPEFIDKLHKSFGNKLHL
ncbi:hypothetical protein TWF481_001957 [Arthrobotrys musiformis]|uniref:C2H2-type domain-containing protein n=1 Tax=Arthrobotrys musiformis TaxID=47236 RepID=A0AAV9VVW6_9PEZI